MSPNKNKTKHPKSIVKSTKIPKIYFSQRVLTYIRKKIAPQQERKPFLKKGLLSLLLPAFEPELKSLHNRLAQQFHRLKTDFAVKQCDR